MRCSWTASAIVAAMVLSAGGTIAEELAAEAAAKLDQAVISKLSSLYGGTATIIAHVDLSKPFGTKSHWTLVIGKQPDKESTVVDGTGEPIGAVSVCFVNNALPDCSEAMFLAKYREHNIQVSPGERPFYELGASDVVYSGPGKTLPLLMIKTGTWRGANGSHGIFTFLFDYDRKADGFRAVFFNRTGSNGNQETRFIETGPLLGDVVVADPRGAPPPSRRNPYAYSVEVYKRSVTGRYARVLTYRGGTRYGDGNPLAVIDSEMPEILRRLGLWRPGDALPVPPRMPAACTRLVMRKGVEWCE